MGKTDNVAHRLITKQTGIHTWWAKDLGRLVKAMYRNLGLLYLCVILCSLCQLSTALKWFSLDQFSSFKKPAVLCKMSSFTLKKTQKDLGQLYNIKLAPTLALKSTMIASETGIFTFMVNSLYTQLQKKVYTLSFGE